MTETGRELTNRLNEIRHLLASDHARSTGFKMYAPEVELLIEVAKAAQEYRDDMKRPRKRDPVTRAVTLDFTTQQRLATKLDEALKRLHSQASDEGNHDG